MASYKGQVGRSAKTYGDSSNLEKNITLGELVDAAKPPDAGSRALAAGFTALRAAGLCSAPGPVGVLSDEARLASLWGPECMSLASLVSGLSRSDGGSFDRSNGAP